MITVLEPNLYYPALRREYPEKSSKKALTFFKGLFFASFRAHRRRDISYFDSPQKTFFMMKNSLSGLVSLLGMMNKMLKTEQNMQFIDV
jgi:hypothetical protein